MILHFGYKSRIPHCRVWLSRKQLSHVIQPSQKSFILIQLQRRLCISLSNMRLSLSHFWQDTCKFFRYICRAHMVHKSIIDFHPKFSLLSEYWSYDNISILLIMYCFNKNDRGVKWHNVESLSHHSSWIQAKYISSIAYFTPCTALVAFTLEGQE